MPLPLVNLLSRLDRWPRRLAAVACLALAAASALAARSSQPSRASAHPPSAPVVVAAHDLGAGRTLTPGDLATAAWPRKLVPAGAAATPAGLVGRRSAGPIGRGEAITAARLVGAGLTAGLPPGIVAAAVRTDAGVAGLIHPGDRVDVLAGPVDDGGVAPAKTNASALLVAQAVAVLAVLPPSSAATGTGEARVLIATDRGTALRIVALQDRRVLAVVADPP